MKISVLLVAFSLSAASVYSQRTLLWDHLADVTFEERYVEKTDAYYLFPTFGASPLEFEGISVTVKGYIFPLDVEGDFYVLSKYPFSACFFCGMAGPETIIEIQFKGKDRKRYKMDEEVTVTGILVLNPDDIEHCNYILTQAEEE
jgi:hypothetical protein